MRKLVVITALICVTCATASAALTDVVDYWAPQTSRTSEINLYDIYNQIYGTSYDSTSTGGVNPLSAVQLDPDEVFYVVNTALPIGGVELRARYAGFNHRFGYYGDGSDPITDPRTTGGDPTSDTPGGTYHWLFNSTTDNVLDTDPFVAQAIIATSDAPIGFYDHAPLADDIVWYSQSALNEDGQDHMVAFWVPDPVSGDIEGDRFMIAFEDTYGLGDSDYNDLVVEIYLPGTDPRDPVPEPASLALLGLGLSALVVRRRFKA